MFFSPSRALIVVALLAGSSPAQASKKRAIEVLPYVITGRVLKPVAVFTLGGSSPVLEVDTGRRATTEAIEQATQKAPF